jgi:hypothetical protein
MSIRTTHNLRSAIVLALLTFATHDVRAETACDENTVRARLAKLEEAFHQSKVQAKLSAANMDWQDDQDFDSEENANYLGTVAAYLGRVDKVSGPQSH